MRYSGCYILLFPTVCPFIAAWGPSSRPQRPSSLRPSTTTTTSRRDTLSSVLCTPLLLLPTFVHAKDLKEEYRQGTFALSENEEPIPREAYKTLPSGVIIADLRQGTGDVTIQKGSKVNLQWVLRRSNGYFVDSSERNGGVPFIFNVGDGTAIEGVNLGIIGMKEGGVRRLLIPLNLAYVEGIEDGKPGPLPGGYFERRQISNLQIRKKDVPGAYVYLEVQATRVR